MTDFYDQLIAATEQERNDLLSHPFIQQGWKGELSLESYLGFLAQAFHHVKHTTPLLMACGSRISHSSEWLRNAMAEYIEEEVGHQEWILNDIKACGADAEVVRHSIPAAATELMVAYAYYIIDRVNPVGFFGMVLVLEGTSIKVASQAAEKLQENLALPKTAFSYLSSHGSLDIAHMDFYRQLVNKIDNPADQVQIVHCAKMFYGLYKAVFDSLPITPLKAGA